MESDLIARNEIKKWFNWLSSILILKFDIDSKDMIHNRKSGQAKKTTNFIFTYHYVQYYVVPVKVNEFLTGWLWLKTLSLFL